MIKRFLLYLLRWQLSTPILALCLLLIPGDYITRTIVANFIGGIVFFFVDKRIFKDKNKDVNKL